MFSSLELRSRVRISLVLLTGNNFRQLLFTVKLEFHGTDPDTDTDTDTDILADFRARILARKSA